LTAETVSVDGGQYTAAILDNTNLNDLSKVFATRRMSDVAYNNPANFRASEYGCKVNETLASLLFFTMAYLVGLPKITAMTFDTVVPVGLFTLSCTGQSRSTWQSRSTCQSSGTASPPPPPNLLPPTFAPTETSQQIANSTDSSPILSTGAIVGISIGSAVVVVAAIVAVKSGFVFSAAVVPQFFSL